VTSVAKTAKTGTHWRRIFALTVFGVLMLAALAFANSGRAAIETPPPPSVWSDKADYAPGEQVTLSGANWAPGESVHIRVNDDAGETWRRDIDVTADASGAISDQFNLPDWFVAQYAVTATGASSGTATWSFTDSNPQTITVTPGSVSVAQGSTVNYTVTLTVGGNNNACTVTFAAGGLPAGATATFGTNPVTTTGANVVTSLSISTTGSTPTGSFPISVTGTNSGAGCQGPGPTSGTATLVVTSGSVNTTTLAQSKTATFGDSSVALTATVTPASGPAPSVGTVSFTVKKGATTIGTAGPAAVTSGSANANFSLSGVGADTYTIEAAYSGGTGFNASNNSAQSPAPTLTIAKASSTTTVTCPASVTYDGSPQTPCSASVTGAGGLNQSLTVDYTDNTNAGTATASASFAGDANHNSSSDSETFVIAKRSVTASITAADKTYDGTDDASITSCSLEAEDGNHGVVSPDDADCSATNGHFADADAGVGKNVTADVELIGADKANYQLTSASASTTATIFKRSVTASITAADKTYDGTDDASITSCSLEAEDGNHGVVSPDDVDCSATNGHFGNKNVGNGKTVAADVELIGADKANYQLTSPSAMTTANVSMRDLTVTATGVNKVYDGTTTASVNLSTDKVSGDNVSASYASASFAGKDVGNNKPVSVSGISISGSDAGNYNLLNTIASTTANITPRPVTASITAADKVFDNNTTATITNCSLEAQSGGHGVVTGEAVGCSATNGQFNNANVGSGKTVTANVSLTGGDSGNYQLTSPTASTTANITAWNAAGKGFYQPVGADAAHSIFTAAPGSAPTGKPASMEWNTVKGGSTVPLKFNVFAGSVEQTSLSSTFDAVPFRAVKLPACTDAGSEDLVDFTTTGSTTLRYDGTGGQWIQNWATPKVNTDTCYRAWVTFADGSSIESFFKLKR
jgi:hypothetical protein